MDTRVFLLYFYLAYQVFGQKNTAGTAVSLRSLPADQKMGNSTGFDISPENQIFSKKIIKITAASQS
ncbi:hypothetical protein QUA05_12340 [Microcoleus sp. SVA1_A1]